MSDTKIRQIVSECIDERLGDLQQFIVLLEGKFPELLAVGVGAQPCDTEFTTEGEKGPLNNAGFLAAYNDAKATAQTLCNTGNCKKLTFVKYVKAKRTALAKWKLEIAWKCEKQGS